MSLTYSDLTFSQFPDELDDSYEYMSDLTLDLLELSTQYNSLISSKKFNEASKLLIDNPSLNKIYFNAEKYNKLIDSIRATQRLYKNDVQMYILELVKNKGVFSSTTKYAKYNVVTYYDSQVYMCISSDCPLGTPPTNTDYWYPLSIKGEKGVGIGLSYDGVWKSNFTYNKDSCVTYNNVLYASVIDNNIGKTPSQNSSYWSLVFDMSEFTVYDNSSSNLNSTNLQEAIDELNISINNNTNKLNTIENGAQKNTVTGVKGSSESNYRTGNINITPANLGITVINNTRDSDKSVNYSASSNYANGAGYANSAGNSDSVDGFHFQISSTDLEAGVSALSTNVFCFVYE